MQRGDPLTFVLMVFTQPVAALCASFVPARRPVNPVKALRQEPAVC